MKKLILNEKQYNRLQNIIIDKAIISEQTKSQIMIIQQRLKECFNAYLGTSGPNRDGVDGVAGNKTKTAIETYTKYRFDQGDSGTHELALNNDIEGMSKEILKNVGSSAEFGKMNRIQQDALAKYVGMTVEELTKSLEGTSAIQNPIPINNKISADLYYKIIAN
jgi:hypothetical protein